MPADLDARLYTVMSYTAYPDSDTYFSYEPTTPMVLDIAAIQSLYGANTSYNSGNTNYVFSEQSIYNETIWDAGDIDTFIYNSSSGGKINLTAGVDNGSLMGLPVYIRDSFGNNLYVFYSIMIANGVVIENATGGSGDDLITGNSANNILIGGLGNDTLAGGTGLDYFLFNTPLSESNNKDLITDFNIVDDVIQLENSIMTSIGSTTGVLASTEFFVGAAAHDADDSIIYNKSTGALYYDKDGTGISAAVQIAMVGTTSHPSLTYADFWVV